MPRPDRAAARTGAIAMRSSLRPIPHSTVGACGPVPTHAERVNPRKQGDAMSPELGPSDSPWAKSSGVAPAQRSRRTTNLSLASVVCEQGDLDAVVELQ